MAQHIYRETTLNNLSMDLARTESVLTIMTSYRLPPASFYSLGKYEVLYLCWLKKTTTWRHCEAH